ncbi:kelch repeat and BTB domain-containing protein 11 [Alosa sapidissima]|uniref:kelch repeat and BTB domain-containing protein 11 n=1 Tax=Alosa sapidissima TaxID=34773 RepID=UPI001C0932B1|nr:kelch repeat and BTB domain-containing protein 11 [Alosa sapidissima]XP_041928902.1 kelch repeat and BTB domain-containing protein 11 [Alosa sapidissima]
MQNDCVSSNMSAQSLNFDQGSVNVALQGPNTFTVEADVIFHAASPDSPGTSINSVEKNQGVSEAAYAASDMELLRDEQSLHQQWTEWDTNVPEDQMGSSVIGLLVGDCMLDGGSRDSGFQDHVQPLDTSKAQELNPERDHHNSLHKNGIKEESNGARPKVPCSLGPCFKSETKDELDNSSLFGAGNAVRSHCQMQNVSSVPEEPLLTSRDLGNMINMSHLTQNNSVHGHPELTEGSTGNVKGDPSSKENPDLVIEVGGQKIQAHKSVLAEKSDYFKARLSRDILKVKGVNYKTLTTLIDYVYTSQMNVTKDNVVDVITGAKILQIPCAVQAAMDTMSQQITTENCYEILSIAKKQRLSELKETAYRFMSDHFLQVLKDPAVYGRLTGSERDLILRTRMDGKKSLMVAEINDVFDRVSSRPQSRNNSRPQSPLSVASFEENHMIYYYSESTKDWRALTLMPEEINTKGCGICTMYNYLFVAGGIKGYGDKGKVSDKVFCYNPITDRWSEVRPMNQARSQLKLVSVDGYLYAIGGECLFTVEKYDPRMDRWTTVAPLPKGAFAVAHEATTCNGELYVSGGSLFYRLLRYDPKRDEWQECPYNNSRKRSTDMVALKSFIYRFDINREQGVNVFKYNTIVKMWHDCSSLQQSSPQPFRCAVIGNCIYCVNKSQTLQFVVEEENAQFVEEPLKAPIEAKGILFPFILSLPERGKETCN